MSEKEKVNILLVDDQPAKLLTYEVMLSELGENLIKTTSGRDALEQLLKNDVAVVLMDVSMPELDGFELAEMIRQHPRFQRTAIIFISAVHLTDLDRIKGYQRGAVDYISVPVVPELLRAKVSIFAELHRKTHQLERLNRELEQRVAERTAELAAKALSLQQLNFELIRKNLELDAIVQTAPDTIFRSLPDGQREYTSERFHQYTGATDDSGNGFGWLDYVHAEDVDRCKQEWMHAVTSGKKYESEFRLRGKDHQYRWFRARAIPIRDQDGAVLRWYGSCSDIHDSKMLEKSIRENAAQLEKMVDQRTTALRHLSSRLMKIQDEERRRVARELHDGLGQDLAAAKMLLDASIQEDTDWSREERITDVVELIDHAIQQVRSVSHLLHPPLLDEVGLLSALRWYLDGITKRSSIETSLYVTPNQFPRLTPEVETAVFRIVQEALTNVYRHSGARQAEVTLICEGEFLKISVKDNGKGIEASTAELWPGGIGIGIGGMRQRAKELGGDLRLANVHPGTLVEAVSPCANAVAYRASAD